MDLKKIVTAGLLSISFLTLSIPVNASTGYHRTKTTPVSHKKYYSVSMTGKTFKANGSTKHFKFTANHYLKNYRTTTWTRTHKTYITKHGKKYLYYYVRNNTKKNVSGWVWSGYLKSGNYSASYKASPTAIRGYYVLNNGRIPYTLKITKRYFTIGAAQMDEYPYKFTKIQRKGSKYYFKGYIKMGGKHYTTMNIKINSKNRIIYLGSIMQKVSKNKFTYFKFHSHL